MMQRDKNELTEALNRQIEWRVKTFEKYISMEIMRKLNDSWALKESQEEEHHESQKKDDC